MRVLFDNGRPDLRATTGRARACSPVQVRPLAIASCLVVMSQVAVAGTSGHTREIAVAMQQPAGEDLHAMATSSAPLRLAIHVNRESVEGDGNDEGSQGNAPADGENDAGNGARADENGEAPEQSSGGDAE